MKKKRVLSLMLVTVLSAFSFVSIAPVKTVTAATTSFVQRSGRYFYLNGAKFYFAGNNTYYAGLVSDQATQASIFSANAAKGVKVMRIWAFNNGSGGLQTSIGVYNETALRQLDYAVYQAQKNGIKLILPFVNYWSDYNGMQWYVNQVLGSGSEDLFYTNSSVETAYKNYVNTILNRTNYYTGVQYKSDPTIFAWELANEPRCTSDTTGTTLYNWINTMATYIKGVDTNHMVSVGDEGFKTGGSDWTSNGYEGDNWLKNIENSKIDFATIHLYPDNWGESLSWCTSFLQDRATLAHSTAVKPIVLEEYGRSASDGDRDSVFTSWHSTATNSSYDYDGLLPWQMEINTPWDSTFGFTNTSTTANLISSLATVENAKSK
ncbi:glycoside hydrolase 5 family protein [Clostridium akagii]|uniref:glycoside hydrolase 5 family protein n=1 Tax=Clostridium akagii TaxID=91623 RepID=UPI0006900FB4|nr:cellulase family glycosylhydrolase [Clostridium akagii]